MRILIVSDYHASYYTGGNERYADTLATALLKQGIDVTYLAAAGDSAKAAYRLVTSNSLLTLARLIQTAEVVHGSGSGFLQTVSGFLARLYHKPSVLTFQAPHNPPHPVLKSLSTLLEAIDVYGHPYVITTSPANERHLKNRYHSKLVRHILLSKPSSFTPPLLSKARARAKLKLKKDITYVLQVAKMDKHHYYKGVDVTLNALAKLPPSYHLLVVGSGENQTSYQKRVHELAISDRVSFTGQVGDAALSLFYKAADIFVLPSVSSSEGFGLVLLEAMLCHTPVITTSVVGISELLKKRQAGIIIPPKNPGELADAIRSEAVNNRTTVAAGVEFARSCTVEKMCQQTINFYQEVLRKSHGS